ncbi:MAG TPA: DUF3332 family protein [Bacteroidota bacterium]|nr:DUF3332 family protein [Bacteroidota bacterium]
MKNGLKNLVCVLLIGAMCVTSFGCYGSFNLVKKVYKFNGTVGEKWVNEIVFLVLNIVPVYGAAAAIDAVILNTIEFWTGTNPVMAQNAAPVTMKEDDGSSITFNASGKEMDITKIVPGKGETTFRVMRENGQSVVEDNSGNILARCVSADDGGMTLFDSHGNVLHTYSKTQVEAFAMR